MSQSELEESLEHLIDKTSLHIVLGCLAQVCFAKSEHIGSNWQDRNLAKGWEQEGKRLMIQADTTGL
jgi:hypothetical protein